jgi:hypothetical protein
VVNISDSALRRDILASIEIESKVKNLSALFDYIKQDLIERNYKIERINDYSMNLTTRKFLKKETISIEDFVETNTLSIEISLENILIPEAVKIWMDKRFLRLKNSVWLILFLLMTVMIPIIIVGYVNERLLMLRIFGIVLLCSAGLFTILYTTLNPLAVRRRLKRKNQASEFIDKIKALVIDYSEKEMSGKICWNCFTEIKESVKICPNCNVGLKE